MDKITKKRLIIIIGVIILPLVYSLFYLGGFWDPYNSLSNVKVAVVNEDKCIDNQCKGEQFTNELLKDGTFDFVEVSEEKAETGLVDEKYYAIIKIPSDFTKDLLSASEKNKNQATITYRPNTKSNYLASQILSTAMKEIQMKVEASVTEEVVGTLTTSLQSVPEKTQKISDGLETIYNGTVSLNSGTNTLKEGTTTLKNSYNKFDNGITTALSGSTKLYTLYGTFDDGINSAYNGAATLKQATDSLPALVSGVNNLNSGATNLKTGIKNYTNSVNNALSIYTYLNNYCTALKAQNIKVDDNLSGLCESANNFLNNNSYQMTDANGNVVMVSASTLLSNSATSLNSGAETLALGTSQLNSKVSSLTALKEGIDSLESGLATLKDNSKSIYSALGSLNDGLNTLSTSSKAVSSGISKLDSGASTLNDGSKTLSEGVKTAKDEVDKSIKETKTQTDKLDGLDKHTANAVKTKTDSYGDVNTYGVFFSPYFMSLSLWIGGLLILIGLYYDPDNRFKILGRDTNHRVYRLLGYGALAVIQALALGFILKATLGFEITNLALYYASCILISITFLSIITFLIFIFGDVGKFLAIVFLVLQLASCGGTFPIETEPALYKAIYPFMPMTYSVDLLRESFVNINSNFLTKDVIILILISVLFISIIIVREIYKIRKEKKNNNKIAKKGNKEIIKKEAQSKKINKKIDEMAKNKAKK